MLDDILFRMPEAQKTIDLIINKSVTGLKETIVKEAKNIVRSRSP